MAPTHLQVAQLSPTENLLGWNWKETEEAKFFSYEIEYDDQKGTVNEEITKKSQLRLTELSPGTEYRVRIHVYCRSSNGPCICSSYNDTMRTLKGGMSKITHEDH